MNTAWVKLAGDLLDVAADEFGNHGCNDWEFPKEWTTEQRRAFAKAYHEWNGDEDAYDPDHPVLMDYAVMGFLAAKLADLSSTLSAVLHQLEHGEASDFLDGTIVGDASARPAAERDLRWCLRALKGEEDAETR